MTDRKAILWDAEIYKPKRDEHYNCFCLDCGVLITDGRRTRFCSEKCDKEFHAKHPVITWSEFKWQVFQRDNFTCKSCGTQNLPKYTDDKKYLLEYPELECDHIIPLFLGGTDFDLDNSQTICPKCHKKKSREEAKLRTKTEVEVREKGQKRLVVLLAIKSECMDEHKP